MVTGMVVPQPPACSNHAHYGGWLGPHQPVTTGIGSAYQPPAAAGKQAKAIHDQRPALVKTVDRSWDRLTGAWDWVG